MSRNKTKEILTFNMKKSLICIRQRCINKQDKTDLFIWQFRSLGDLRISIYGQVKSIFTEFKKGTECLLVLERNRGLYYQRIIPLKMSMNESGLIDYKRHWVDRKIIYRKYYKSKFYWKMIKSFYYYIIDLCSEKLKICLSLGGDKICCSKMPLG